jgi:hypothetical protein
LLSWLIDIARSIIKRASDMAPPRCLCDAIFGTIFSLRNHATLHGHSLECECGALFSSKELLKEHQNGLYWDVCNATTFKKLQVDGPRNKIPGHFYCGVCRDIHNPLSTQRDEHLVSDHNACPTCFQVFDSLVDCMEHQAHKNHSYCPDHEIAFPRLEELVQHSCADSHNEGILCMCHEVFFSYGDYDRHLSNGHRNYVDIEGDEKARLLEPTYAEEQLSQIEHANLWCKDCDWRFVNVEAYLDHKASPRHEAKSLELECSCGKIFSHLSALVAHLESGGCRASGMTRNKLNGIVYNYDKDRRITKDEFADRFAASTIAGSSKASIAPGDSASLLGVDFDRLSISGSHTGTVLDETSTVQTGGFLTPDGSEFTITDDNDFVATPSVSNESSSSRDTVFINTPTASTGTLTPTTGSHVSTGTLTLTPTVSTDGDDSFIFTPPGSSINGGFDEWAFVNTTPGPTSLDGSSVATIRFDSWSKSWPCSKCPRTFKAKKDLVQHMASATRAPKIFNDPTKVVGRDDTPTSKRDFKLASGLLQHVEREASKGDKGDLETILEIMEKPVDKKFQASMKSLE